MLLSALMIVVYIVTGLAIVVGGVLGAAWYLAREINAGHENTCSCPNCQRKRQRAWQAKHPNAAHALDEWIKDKKPPPEKSRWVSTLELQPGQRVIGKESGSVYRVESVKPIGYGFMVVISNITTKGTSRIPIAADKASHRIWLLREEPRKGAGGSEGTAR